MGTVLSQRHSAQDRFANLMEERGNSIKWSNQPNIDILVINQQGFITSVVIHPLERDEDYIEIRKEKADYVAKQTTYGFLCVRFDYLVEVAKQIDSDVVPFFELDNHEHVPGADFFMI